MQDVLLATLTAAQLTLNNSTVSETADGLTLNSSNLAALAEEAEGSATEPKMPQRKS